MIVKGIVDVGIIRNGNNNVNLLTDCGGYPFDSLAISSGPVIMRRRNTIVNVELFREEGGECIDQILTVGNNVAQKLMLKNRRYRVVFDTETRVMNLFSKPVTRGRL
ncbi:hypothetical protein GQF04_23940, partial [Paenibacillus aceris]